MALEEPKKREVGIMSRDRFENGSICTGHEMMYEVYVYEQDSRTWHLVAKVFTMQHAFWLAKGMGYGDRIHGCSEDVKIIEVK